MGERLKGKVAIVMGAGQQPGETIGNGRATALVFAREGARCLCVDLNLEAAEETRAMIAAAGGEAAALAANATSQANCKQVVESCLKQFGRLDILQNNVGVGDGDASLTHIKEADWDRILQVNLKSVVMPCKAAIPVMRERHGGAVINISSISAICSSGGMLAYKTAKAGVNALTHQLAMTNARFLVRVNAIMPGLMDTPIAIEGYSRARNLPRERVRADRDAQVPLGHKQGTAWDVAYASLFLASDEARFITGVLLPVDGGQSARIG